MTTTSPELDPIFAQLRSDAWDKALDGIDGDKARAIIVQLFGRLPETERMALVRDLDSIEYPWGEPGVVPTEPGEYWVAIPADLDPLGSNACQRMYRYPIDAPFCAGDWHGYAVGPNELIERLARENMWRFRKRWTPEAP